jgi:hypothetical protein
MARGVVRCGVVRCGVVRCGVVRCGVVRCGVKAGCIATSDAATPPSGAQ